MKEEPTLQKLSRVCVCVRTDERASTLYFELGAGAPIVAVLALMVYF